MLDHHSTKQFNRALDKLKRGYVIRFFDEGALGSAFLTDGSDPNPTRLSVEVAQELISKGYVVPSLKGWNYEEYAFASSVSRETS